MDPNALAKFSSDLESFLAEAPRITPLERDVALVGFILRLIEPDGSAHEQEPPNPPAES